MRSLRASLAAALFIACPIESRAQSVLAPGHVAVVTTDGFFVPDPNSPMPLLFVPAASFGGATTLLHPAVEWERGTDRFLVAAAGALYRVDLLSLSPPQFSVTDLTPASAQPLELYDLDLEIATGELLVVDLGANVLLRFAPPFALGMTPFATLAIAPSARAIAVDTRSYPHALVHVESQQVTRVPLDGSAPSVVILLPSAGGIDHDVSTAGKQGTFVTAKGSNQVARATSNPNLVIDLNYSGFCSPLALAPVDVEWDPSVLRAFVLAEDGINPACAGASGATGKNHVVRLPLAQGPVGPTLVTFPGGSGITGTNGDLAVVTTDFEFVSPVGAPCPAAGPVLDLDGPPLSPSSSSATLVVTAAPSNAPVFVIASANSQTAPLPFGCLVLASPALVFGLGSTNGAGASSVTIPIPPLPPGIDVHLQAAVLAPGLRLSERLAVHVGM